jgi:branched-chain amino acid transport system permease protein
MSKLFSKKALAHSWFLILLGFLILMPYSLGLYTTYLFTWTCLYFIVAMGLNLILGYAGQISLAQAAFMGIGAYTVALFMGSISFWLALFLGGAISFGVGMLLGFPSLKVKHHYLAMVTLAFNIVVYYILMNEEEITGGPYGIFKIARPQLGPFDFTSDLSYAQFVSIVTFLMLLLMYWILNSQWGRAFKSIRENEIRAEMLGVHMRNYKLFAFALGSFYAGIGGGLIGPLYGYIDPTMFNLELSLEFLLMVIIGGLGRFEGPFIGVPLVILLPQLLHVTRGMALVYYALTAILLLIFMPKGMVTIWDWIFKLVIKREAPKLTK